MSFVTVNISLDSANPSELGFGTPLLLSAGADAPFVGDRVRTYTSREAVAVDFTHKTGPEYLWADAVFAQNPRVKAIQIGRLANKPTMIYLLSLYGSVVPGATYRTDVDGDGVTSTAVRVTLPATDIAISAVANASETFTATAHGMVTGDGPYRLTNSGGGLPSGTSVDTDYWVIKVTADTFQLATSYANAIAETELLLASDGTGTHTLVRTSNDVLMALLKDRLNAVPGKNYTVTTSAGVGDTDTLIATGNAAGNWFSFAVDPRQLVSAQVYNDPGVAADLDAIQEASADWYCVHNVYNSKAITLAIANWVEGAQLPHYYECETSNTLSVTAGAGTGGNHIGDSFKALGLTRTRVTYYPRPQRMHTARQSGRLYPLEPGQVDAVYKQLAGSEAVAFTPTHEANLLATNMSSYHVEKGVAVTFGGKMASGEWWDILRSLDAIRDQLAVEGLKVRLNNDILPMTDGGISSLESAVRTVIGNNTIVPGVRDKAIIADTPAPTYVIPRATDITTGNRTARRAGPLSCQFRMAGSINELEVTLNVTQ